MDYAKSSDPEIGVVIERHKWVEGTEIGYRISDIGVGMGSNNNPKLPNMQTVLLLTVFVLKKYLGFRAVEW